ncbi:MAG: hypothetical protein M1823_000068 [Watsoniomyces obsoletus]|nr:MAG: hypothetical protein M1823_000068 [Watsoniomyces obsoletus]
MTCNIPNRSSMSEPLPVYTARSPDIETSSILSAAPSYTSAAPSYRSRLDGSSSYGPISASIPRHQRAGARNPWENRNTRPPVRRPLGEADLSVYSVPAWSGVRSSHQERLYQSVAQRRVDAAASEARALAAAVSEGVSLREPLAIYSVPEASEASQERAPDANDIESAERERQECIRKKQRDQEALDEEDKTWGFMLQQMADWEERERSWAAFRRRAEQPGLLKRKMARFGTGRW